MSNPFTRNVEPNAKVGTSKTPILKVFQNLSKFENGDAAIIDATCRYTGYVYAFKEHQDLDCLLHDCIVEDGKIVLLTPAELDAYGEGVSFKVSIHHFVQHWKNKKLNRKQALLCNAWHKRMKTLFA